MRKFLLFVAVLGLAGYAPAQQVPPGPSPAAPASSPPPPLPPGPLLKPMPDNTRCTLTITSQSTEAAKPGDSSQSAPGAGPVGSPSAAKKSKSAMVREKIGKSVHVLDVASNGDRQEQWTDGNLTATLGVGAKEPIYTTTRLENLPMPSWVSKRNYVDLKTEGNKNYLIFKDRIIPSNVEVFEDFEKPGQNNTEKLKVDATAVIDLDTRQPIAVKEGESTTAYKFEPLDPATEIIPAPIRKSLGERGKKLQDSKRMPVRP